MGRPKNPPSSPASDNGQNRAMERQLEEMNRKLTTMVDEIRSLAESLKQAKQENVSMKETITQQADEIADLRNKINDRELHARSWSIRANNIPLREGQETNNKVVMNAVYSELVAPILAGAVAAGEIASVPPCESLIEIAHILPGRGAKKPIIVRFFSRYWRSLLFRFRKDFAPREASAVADRAGRMKFPFYEDLTRATFKQLKAIQADEKVTAAWTVSGIIRFKIENDEAVYKVTNIYDTVADLTE
jgi:hypothetical protein